MSSAETLLNIISKGSFARNLDSSKIYFYVVVVAVVFIDVKFNIYPPHTIQNNLELVLILQYTNLWIHNPDGPHLTCSVKTFLSPPEILELYYFLIKKINSLVS